MTEPAAERSDWSAADTTLAEVIAAIRRLSAEHMAHEHGHATTWTLSLVITPAPAARVRDGIDALHAFHPPRLIVLREHRPDRLDAEVTVHCSAGAHRRPGYCHEEVVLTAPRARVERADLLVRPLLLGDVPVVVWVPGADVRPAESLGHLADLVVVDSAAGGEPLPALRRAVRLGRRCRVADLAWVRLGEWRGRLARAAEPPDGRRVVLAADRLEIRHGAGGDVHALLLAGWVAARLGWHGLSLSEDPGGRAGGAARPGGGSAEVALVLDAGVPGRRVGSVALHAGDAVVEVRDPRAVHPRAVLADALARLDDPAHGYEEALAALGVG